MRDPAQDVAWDDSASPSYRHPSILFEIDFVPARMALTHQWASRSRLRPGQGRGFQAEPGRKSTIHHPHGTHSSAAFLDHTVERLCTTVTPSWD
jgi:hypothetical protein